MDTPNGCANRNAVNILMRIASDEDGASDGLGQLSCGFLVAGDGGSGGKICNKVLNTFIKKNKKNWVLSRVQIQQRYFFYTNIVYHI